MIPIRKKNFGRSSTYTGTEQIFYPKRYLEFDKKREKRYETGTVLSVEHRNLSRPFHLWGRSQNNDASQRSLPKCFIDGELTQNNLDISNYPSKNWIYFGQYNFSSTATNTHIVNLKSSSPISALYLTNDETIPPPESVKQFEKRFFGFKRSKLGHSSLGPNEINVMGESIFQLEYKVPQQGISENGGFVIGIPWGIFPIPYWEGLESTDNFQMLRGGGPWGGPEPATPFSTHSDSSEFEYQLLPFWEYSFRTREYLVHIKPLSSLQPDSKVIFRLGDTNNQVKVSQSFPYKYKEVDKIRWYTPTVPMRLLVDPMGQDNFLPLKTSDSHSLTVVPKKHSRDFVFSPSTHSNLEKLKPKGFLTTDELRNPVCNTNFKKEHFSLDESLTKNFVTDIGELSLPYFKSRENDFQGFSNPSVNREMLDSYDLFWGDIHGHCGVDDGVGKLSNYFSHGKEFALLDFTAISAHAEYLTVPEWNKIKEMANKLNKPGKFVVLNGFEWTSPKGHKNVYTPQEELQIIRSTDYTERHKEGVEKFWHQMKELNDQDVVVIPHHTLDGHEWDLHDPKSERLVEIYSMWGSSEYKNNPLWDKDQEGPSVRELLDAGAKLGFTGGSDNHEGRPGLSADSEGTKSRYGNLTFKNGLTAVLAKDLTRWSIFNALLSRRTFATTGNRMVLLLKVNGEWMGSEVDSRKLNLELFCAGKSDIKELQVIKDGELVRKFEVSGKYFSQNWRIVEEDWKYLYTKAIQKNGEVAWTSPVFRED